jgi:hypothetical protein
MNEAFVPIDDMQDTNKKDFEVIVFELLFVVIKRA